MSKTTSTSRVKEFQKRLKEKGLKEIRGAYAESDKHPEIKQYIKEKYIGEKDENTK